MNEINSFNDELLVKLTSSSNYTEYQANSLVLTGEEGEFGILSNHCNFIANLKDGPIKILLKDKIYKYFIFSGIVQINDNIVLILGNDIIDLALVDKTILQNKLDHLKLLYNDPDNVLDKLYLDKQIKQGELLYNQL